MRDYSLNAPIYCMSFNICVFLLGLLLLSGGVIAHDGTTSYVGSIVTVVGGSLIAVTVLFWGAKDYCERRNRRRRYSLNNNDNDTLELA